MARNFTYYNDSLINPLTVNGGFVEQNSISYLPAQTPLGYWTQLNFGIVATPSGFSAIRDTTSIRYSNYFSSNPNFACGLTFNGFWLLRGNLPNRGGFYISSVTAIASAVANSRLFWGVCDIAIGGIVKADPSSKTANNFLGVARDAGDTNFQIMSCNGAGVVSKVDTGIAPVITHLYYLIMLCNPNSNSINLSLTDLTLGSVVINTNVNTLLPSLSVPLALNLLLGTPDAGGNVQMAVSSATCFYGN